MANQYTNIISRSDIQATIPEVVSNMILNNLKTESAAASLFRQTRMPTNQTRMPVLAALPAAYFVNGDSGLKQTTKIDWANKYLNVEEVAAIVPIPEAVLDDTSYDVWGTLRPLLETAIARVVDGAIFFGTNKPASWPNAIFTDADAIGNHVTLGHNAAAAGGIAQDISDLMALIEAQGFDPNGFVAPRTMRAKLRSARDTLGQRLLDVNPDGNTIEGSPVRYAMSGLWPSGSGVAEMFTGDFMQGIFAVRQDMTYKILDQSVIQDNTGAIIYNLAQQDMVALRLVFRCAFQVANTINYQQPVEAQRYPFATLKTA